MAYTAPFPVPSLYPGWNGLPAGEFLLPVCTTRERMVKLLNALNTYGVLADDNNLDFFVDILRAIKYVPAPQDAPCSDGCGDPKSCVTFYPWHSGFEFSPGLINGVDDPPAGYAQHPWFTGDRYTVPGFTLQDTDVINDFVSTRPAGGITSPIEQITVSGLPRFRFTFEALTAGTAYIHLLDIPLGGYALVRLDEIDDIDLLITSGLSVDDLLEAVGLIGQLVDDLIDLDPVELIPEHIHELSFGPGLHTIDVLFLPRVEIPNITAIGWGGGIRKIVICGEETVCPDPADDMPRTELRSIPDPENAGCKIIQWKYETEGDTLWRNLATVCDGADGAPGAPGAPGADGECDCPDPFEDEDNTPDPPTDAGNDTPCEVATRTVNSIIDRRYAPFLTDAAIAFQDEGLTAAQLGSALEEWTLAGTAGALGYTGATGQLFWNSWTGVVASLFNIGVGAGGITARVIALWEAQQALDVLAIRNEVLGADAREALTCALYNNLNEDGSIDAATYQLWKSSIAGLTEGISAAARDDFGRFLDALVPLSIVRLSARDPQADTSFDCAACELEYDWCVIYDLKTSLYSWAYSGNYVTGQGIKDATDSRVFGSRQGLSFSWIYGNATGTNGVNLSAIRIRWEGGVISTEGEIGQYSLGAGRGTTPLETWEGSAGEFVGNGSKLFIVDPLGSATGFNRGGMEITLASTGPFPAPGPNGALTITEVRFYGTGTPPDSIVWNEPETC